MSTLSTDAGNFAPPHKITHGDKVFELRHLGLCELAEFERENYRLKREALREFKEDYGQAEYVKRLDELRARYDNNELSMDRDDAFRTSVKGVMLLLRIVTGATDAEVMELFRTQKDEVTSMMELVIRESFGLTDAPEEEPEKLDE